MLDLRCLASCWLGEEVARQVVAWLNAFKYTAMHWSEVPCTTLHWGVLHDIALKCNERWCTALHCIELCFTTMH